MADASTCPDEMIDLLLHDTTEEDVLEWFSGDHTSNSQSAYEDKKSELSGVYDAYVQAHVDCSEEICELYEQFKMCETHINEFDEEIHAFSLQLRETEEIAAMQQQIDQVSMKARNRQQASKALNEVYSAVQECDVFCHNVAGSHAVDEEYLSNLRRLGVKLSILFRNSALQNSAVDREIRPKLTAVAQQAGDRLYRSLAERLQAMPSPQAGWKALEAFHLSLEKIDSFSFTFLKLYNPVVAKRLVILYIQLFTEYYSHLHVQIVDTLTRSEISAPHLINESHLPENLPIHAPIEALLSSSDGLLRWRQLNAIVMRYGNLSFTEEGATASPSPSVPPSAASSPPPSTAWLPAFVKCFLLVVNITVSECRFVGSFFCASHDVGGGEENYTDAEEVAKLLLNKMTQRVQRFMEEHLQKITNALDLLSALRVIAVCKEHVCTSQDPIPLFLLSSLFEVCQVVLRCQLAEALTSSSSVLQKHLQPLAARKNYSSASLRLILLTVARSVWDVYIIDSGPLSSSTFVVSAPKSCVVAADNYGVAAFTDVAKAIQTTQSPYSYPLYRLAALGEVRRLFFHSVDRRTSGLIITPEGTRKMQSAWSATFAEAAKVWLQSSNNNNSSHTMVLKVMALAPTSSKEVVQSALGEFSDGWEKSIHDIYWRLRSEVAVDENLTAFSISTGLAIDVTMWIITSLISLLDSFPLPAAEGDDDTGSSLTAAALKAFAENVKREDEESATSLET